MHGGKKRGVTDSLKYHLIATYRLVDPYLNLD